MQVFLLLVLLLASSVCRAQQLMDPLPIDAMTKLVTYSAVVPTPGVLQSSLLARGKVWANHVGLPAKPPVVVTELGMDVLVVAGSQTINLKYDVNFQMLYYVARVALREGRYQYRFDEYTLVTTNTTGTIYDTAEAVFMREGPPRATGSSYATRQRKAFDEAAGQAAALLYTMLTTSLTAIPGATTDW